MIKLPCPRCGQSFELCLDALAPFSCPNCSHLSHLSLVASETQTLPPRPVDDATLPPSSADEDRTLPGGSAVPAPVAGPVPGYEILGELGRGGMGVVYRARHVKLQREVALKMILAGVHAGGDEVARFRVEAEAIARLQHPGIVQVFEIGEHDGKAFFSLEYCPGGSLAQKLGGTPVKGEEAAALVEKLARAVQAAHEARVVHRDLKPANVLLSADGSPKVTDFGLAKRLDEAGQTQTGHVMGTPSYMAPEQAEGKKDVGPAADIWAMGAILYECLTGRPPFKAATSIDTVVQVVTDDPAPPTRLNPRVPRDLETICLKCLHKDVRKRYGSAEDLADDLRRFLAGEPIVARPVGGTERAVKWVRRNKAVSALLAVVLLTLTAGVAVSWAFAWQAGEEARAARQAETDADREARAAREAEKETKQQKEVAEDNLRKAEWAVYAGKLQLAQAAFADGNMPDAIRYLEECQWDLRGWEHAHLRWRFDTSKQTLKGHSSYVTSVAFSPDGTRIVTGSWDSKAKVWDARKGIELLSLKGHTDFVFSVAFSPDGTRIVTGSQDKTAKVWDARKGTELLSLKGHAREMRSVAFSPDGKKVFAWDAAGKVLAWDAAKGQPTAAANPPARPAPGSAISPNGQFAAKPDWFQVQIIDLRQPAGSPWPFPDAAQRKAYHSEQAALAEKDKQWFAVAFHLGRLLLDDPDNADLKKRRADALSNYEAATKP